MEKTKEENDVYQHEDGVLKTATRFFADEMLPFFKIEGKVVGFQSTDGGENDLKRFRMYEATASYHNDVDVTTYVLYSGKIKHPVSVIKTGINTYQVVPIIMQNDSADEVISNLQEKLSKHEKIEKGDLIPLILTPLMGGTMSQKERIKEAFDITHSVTTVPEVDIRKIEAMVYAMADKFLDSWDLEKIREEIKMTRLGAMLYNDGIACGERQKLEALVVKKVKKGCSVEMIADMLEEDVEVIQQIVQELGENK